MKQRMKCEIAYDGSRFSGYQIQPNSRTVQGEIEKALKNIHKGDNIRVTASGRTDAGVHAHAQVLHFDTPLSIPDKNWKKALNALLPDDVVVHSAATVQSSFHARFDVVKKEYRYRLLLRKEPDVFRRLYTHHCPFDVEVTSMKKAAALLIGTHNFTSFCAANTSVKSKVRTLHQVELVEDGDELIFRFVGNGFLYQMIRILVGTLLEIGTGKRPIEELRNILEKKDREVAGKTVPGCGLILWKVSYDD